MIAAEVRQRIAWSTSPRQLRSLLDRADWREAEEVMALILAVKGPIVLAEVVA